METFQTNFNTKLEELKKEIENEKNKEEPFIKEGQKYFYIDTAGNVCIDNWDNYPIGQSRLALGNCHPFTAKNKEQVRKEVEFKIRERKLWVEIEQFARLNNYCEIDWSNTKQQKWYLCIDDEVDIRYTYYYREPNTTYFTSEGIGKKALDKFGDKIKELYFN